MSVITWPGQEGLGGLILLCLLVASSCPDIQAKALHGLPAILKPENSTIITKEDVNLTITCTAQSSCRDFHLVYWLANNDFIESKFPDGRVSEGPDTTHSDKSIWTVEKELIFSPTKPSDFETTFTCIVQDPSGVKVKNIKLQREPPSQSV